MEKKISIIGGDLRNAYLAEIWANERNEVYIYGFENAKFLNSNSYIKKCRTIEECISKSEIIVSAIPFTKDEIFVNSNFSNNMIKIEEVLKYIESKVLIAGNISKKVQKLGEKNRCVKIIDIMQSEQLAILNSISTVEGAIKIAIEETTTTIHGSNILILGFGRIGKVLSKTLTLMGAKIFCEARKKEDLAWIEAYGYESIELQNLEEYINLFDIVFNTIPYVILDKEKLALMKKETLIIDLASKPGGVDREEAKKNEHKNDLGSWSTWEDCSKKCSTNCKKNDRI